MYSGEFWLALGIILTPPIALTLLVWWASRRKDWTEDDETYYDP